MPSALRAVSTEGFGRLRYHGEIRRRLDADRRFRPYFEQESTDLPPFYVDLVRKDLGRLWDWLPEGALFHDPYACLRILRELEEILAARGFHRLADAVGLAHRPPGASTRHRIDLEESSL